MSIVKNISILLASIIISIVVVEFSLRAVLDEVNYMAPVVERHPTLGHAIVPGTGGHDKWGFRNVSVPETAEVVAIGDSTTYGFSATALQSWPAQLESLSGLRVYNLSLGGYGPLQYLQLLKERSLSLKPQVILIGFYLGNDVWDAYQAASGFEYGSGLQFGDSRGRWFGDLRVWLSRHALTFQVAKYELEGLINKIRSAESSSMERPGYFRFEHPTHQTIFRPICCLSSVEETSPVYRGGYDSTLAMIRDTAATCKANAIDCRFLLFPTKESVYWPIAKPILSGEAKEEVERLVNAEAELRSALGGVLEDNALLYLDLLAAMQKASKSQAIYLPNEDGHPNGRGYAVVARTVHKWLQVSAPLMSEKGADGEAPAVSTTN